jgi:hypothetical protein
MANTLYEYYTGKGEKLPSVSDRKKIAEQYGISDYSGSVDQNNKLLQSLKGGSSNGGSSNSGAVVIDPVSGRPQQNGGTPNKGKDTSAIDSILADLQGSNTKGKNEQDVIDGYNTPVDENKIKRDVMREYRGQIDAIESVYADIIKGENVQGEDRLGQNRAVLNAQGLIGSGRGMASQEKVVDANQDIINSYQKEKGLKIAQLFTDISNKSIQRIKDEREAKKQGLDTYLESIKFKDERKTKEIQAAMAGLFNNQITLDDLTDEEKDTLATTLGVSKTDLAQKYKEYETANTEKPEFFNLSEGQSRYSVDPKTGEVVEVAKKGKTYAPKDGASGDKSYSSFSSSDIDNIYADFDSGASISQMKVGLSKDEADAIDDLYKEWQGNKDKKQFLTKDYFKNIFTDDQLKESAKEAGFRGVLSSWSSEKEKYLTSLENTVKEYRNAGYTDQEILKLMQ